MRTSDSPNAHQLVARHRKATAIAAVLMQAHPLLDTALPCSEYFRDVSTESQDIVAAMAGVVEPSDATWDMAISLVETAERLVAINGGARVAHGEQSVISTPSMVH